ncbi:MAG: hypothetical protein K9M56_04390 [Victivallales bacterium]|nr:hypothetical protein [Victivallales bacterium]
MQMRKEMNEDSQMDEKFKEASSLLAGIITRRAPDLFTVSEIEEFNTRVYESFLKLFQDLYSGGSDLSARI